jgi:hypothetical protein
MTYNDTDKLIASLSRGLVPVRALWPPAYRALSWLAIVMLLLGFLVADKANFGVFVARHAEPRMAFQVLATLVTGITGIVSSFYLCSPDRSSLWRYAALPPLAIWVAASGIGCLRYGLGLGPAGDRLGESTHCFVFIVAISVPLTAFLYATLRRASPLEPLPVALTAALGVAALAAFTLQFFHPFDTTLVDLSVHLAAVGTVIGLATISRRVMTPT